MTALTSTRFLPLRRLLVVAVGLGALAVLPAAHAAPAAPAALEGVGNFEHVVVLTEENESASTTFAATSPAVYLRSLRSKGVFLPNYFGTGHASLDNYLAMTSGQRPRPDTMGDCEGISLYSCVQLQQVAGNGANLADQLEQAHRSWKAYADGAATGCFHAHYAPADPAGDPYQGNSTTGGKNFADRHNPFLYYQDIIGNQPRCLAHQRPFSDLAGDLRDKTLPAFSFITPDTCNDGHDSPCAGRTIGGLTTVDLWAQANLPALLRYLADHNGLLIINFDESIAGTGGAGDYLCAGCAGKGAGGRTGAILVSPRLKAGSTDSGSYDHFSLLRTVEDTFGINQYLGEAAAAAPISEPVTDQPARR